MKKRPIVISLGGSMVVPPDGIDVGYLKGFRRLILGEVRRGCRVIIVVGGGWTARAYQKAAGAVVRMDPEDLDWLGIHATRLNAHLLRTLFRDQAQHAVVKNPMRRAAWNQPVLIAAGWKPGRSTDDIAVRLAKKHGAARVVNLTNVDAVYDRDPRADSGAKAYRRMTWPQYRALVGSAWSPGANAPFDPVASRLAAKWRLEAVIAHGKNLKNLKAILDGKPFRGTLIGASAD